jgi:hypothetical protein
MCLGTERVSSTHSVPSERDGYPPVRLHVTANLVTKIRSDKRNWPVNQRNIFTPIDEIAEKRTRVCESVR